MGRIVAIDYGRARIGLAISDEKKIIASPLTIVLTQKNPAATIKQLLATLASYDIEKVVIGMPLQLNGKKGVMAEEVTQFLQLLQTHLTYPVVSIDERMSTLQAEKALKESQLNRKKRSKVIDTVAATVLLQNYLELQNNIKQ